MINKKEVMTSKDMRTLLFAGIIAAMILPFTAMDFALAEEVDTKREQKIANLGSKISKIQESLELVNDKNDRHMKPYNKIEKVIEKSEEN